MKRILSIVMIVLIGITASGCEYVLEKLGESISESLKQAEEISEEFIYSSEKFKYFYINNVSDEKNFEDGKYVAILELMPQEREKEVIVIPEEIDGKKVVKLGFDQYGWSVYGMVYRPIYYFKGEFKKLYLPPTMIDVAAGSTYALDEKTFMINEMNQDFFTRKISDKQTAWIRSGSFYVPEEHYSKYMEMWSKKYLIESYFHIANLTYEVDNEVYWIDDYEEGEYITQPEEPTKEGYQFEGWYKEKECINKWDFETETYTNTENANTVKLYANWIKI